jgi:transcription initiation factor TFIID subunit 2
MLRRLNASHSAREGNYSAVRLTAFECLLLLRGFQDPFILRYIFNVLRYDSSLLIRRRLAESFINCLPVLVVLEDLAAVEETRGFIEEEGGERKPKADPYDMDRILKALKKEVGKNSTLKENLLSTLL